MKNFLRNCAISFSLGTLVFITAELLFGDFKFESSKLFLIQFGFYQLYAFVLSFINFYYFEFLEKINWNGHLVKRIIIGAIGSIILTMIGFFGLRFFTVVGFKGKSFTYFLENESIRYYTFSLWIILTILITVYFIYYFKKYQETQVKKFKFKAKSESAKYESLKSQLDPHFLFNSLNVLTSLIGENPKKAENFTTKLSKIYRYVLEQKEKDLIPVKEELIFAKNYMELLKMRFEEAIIFKILPDTSNVEHKIVPLSLQLLLENAVKHNVISTEKPLHINIFEENDYLVISNNANPKTTLEKSTKIGIKNIIERYSLLSHKKVIIKKENNLFIVKIPLLIKKMEIMETIHNKEEKYKKAEDRVKELKGFYGNLVSYCVIIPFLIFINYQTSWGFKWFWFPVFGLGIGIVVQAFKVFGYSSSWEDKKLKELMSKK